MKKIEKVKRAKHKKRAAWFFSMPALFFVIVFGWYPLILGFRVSLEEYHFITPPTYIGLANFREIFSDPVVPITFRNTFYYTALSIGLTFFIPIIISILLMEMKKNTIRIMMLLWFIPMASMASNIIWKWFYNSYYGLFNTILVYLGFPALRWLEDSRLAMFCLVLPGLIMFGPGLMYIASLQSVPNEFYEAAELEGARFGQKIWHITLPRLRPIISMLLLLAIIGNMQIFERPYVMTGGGPGMATTTVVMYFYQLSFQSLIFGKGASLAVILFFTILVLIIIQRKYLKENIDV